MGEILILDKSKLTGKHVENYIPTDEITENEERLKGLIDNDVSFSAIVYGYRGTGKSSFVDHVLHGYEDRVIIRFNATKYDDYPKFLRRFIRELYHAVARAQKVKKDSTKFSNLKNIYKHTFYDIKESSKAADEKVKSTSSTTSFSRELNYEKVIDLSTVLAFIYLIFGNNILRKISFGETVMAVIFFVIVAVILAASNLTVKHLFSRVLEKSKSKSRTESHEVSEESLYDDEIAEYHVFNELKEISSNSKLKKVIFVLDELDKLEDDDIKKIFKDLKALILSEDLISILVAGKNYEKLWEGEKDETDGIAGNIFSQKIYVPLADPSHASTIVKSLFIKESQFLLGDSSDYINEKIVKSEGVVRNLINLVLSDIKWIKKASDTSGYEKIPTIEVNSDGNDNPSDIAMKRFYNGLALIEDEINERFKEGEHTKTDEMYKLAYRIIRYIQEEGVPVDEDQKNKAVIMLSGFIKDVVPHLDREEQDMVFDSMFSTKEDISDIHVTVDTDVVTSELVTDVEEDTDDLGILYSINVNNWNNYLTFEEISGLEEFFYDLFNLFKLFANKMGVDTLELATIYYDIEIVNKDKEIDHNSFEEIRTFLKPIVLTKEKDFIINFVRDTKMLLTEKQAQEYGSHINKEVIVYQRSHVAEALLKIFYWKERARTCKYSDLNDYLRSIPNRIDDGRWDIARIETDKNILRAVNIKYYRRNYTKQATIKNTFNAAEKEFALSQGKVNAVDAVLAIFVPYPVNEALSTCLEYTDFIRKNHNHLGLLHFELCYIPYDSQESFDKGIDNFLHNISAKFLI